MDNLLKGNYKLKQEDMKPTKDQGKETPGFEEEAMKKLGGSIAFVMKGKQLVWDDEDTP